MASFVYYWKTPDNERHRGEIDAPDRDAAFARLRAQGIRAIKVEPKGWETGEGYRGVKKRAVAACLVLAVTLTGGLAFWGGTRSAKLDASVTSSLGLQGTVTFQLATPLERQRILGDRVRIENFPTNLFKYPLEVELARFAEPGRPLLGDLDKRNLEDATNCLQNPIRIASNDLTEYIDLKRIVAGIKREMNAYLLGGGTVDGYYTELVKRQKMEIAYRDKAVRHLQELLTASASVTDNATTSGRKANFPGRLANAYAYWLKANASLQAMGIYPLELPDELRSYQLTLELDSDEGLPMIGERTVESPTVVVPTATP